VGTPGIDEERVAGFLRQRVPGATGPFRFELIAGGRSNLTYRVYDEGRPAAPPVVLRRPPLGHVLPTAHDMRREHRVLSALAGTDVPVPRPLALCEDPEVNEQVFYVMEDRPGVILQEGYDPDWAATSAERRAIGDALIETLVRLHAVEPAAIGLADFGRPEGYVERQVRRWARQWEGNRTAPLPEIDELLARLGRALPPASDAAIVHGDYRLGNLALDPDDPGRVVAIFDWEMATLGDPLADLGYTLIYWIEAGESDDVHSGGVTARPGFASRAELIEAYAAASGRAVEAAEFYQVLALTKLAVISEGIYKRWQMGKTVGEGMARVDRRAPVMAARALAIAEGAADPRLRGVR
jgi:aminoglycoside phosphotransferase (APT) family kinase protein